MYVHTFVLQNYFTMKKLFIAALLLTAINTATQARTPKINEPANTTSNWAVDASHSSVKFSVTHLTVSETEGLFKKFNGSIVSKSADFQGATINFTVDVNSINTDDEARDKHLKSDDFFNAEKYPNMSFAGTSFKKVKGNSYILEGNLTIRDVTKKVKFNVNYGGTVKDPWGNIKAGFKAKSRISRKAYGLKWGALTEMGGAVVGDDVDITLSLEFAQKKG